MKRLEWNSGRIILFSYHHRFYDQRIARIFKTKEIFEQTHSPDRSFFLEYWMTESTAWLWPLRNNYNWTQNGGENCSSSMSYSITKVTTNIHSDKKTIFQPRFVSNYPIEFWSSVFVKWSIFVHSEWTNWHECLLTYFTFHSLY